MPDVVPTTQDEAQHDAEASLEGAAKTSPEKPGVNPEAPISALEQFYAVSSKENKPPHNAVTPVKPKVFEDSAD